MKLGQIAEIRMGLVLTRKKADLEDEIKQSYRLVTLKNIDENGDFNDQPLEDFNSRERLNGSHFTSQGDILVRLSYPYTAVCVGEGRIGLLIPSSFAVIKLRSEDFIPDYVAWYLNSTEVKREYLKHQTGTAVATTNKSMLSQIEVKAIPKKDQMMIGELQKLFFKEKKLLGKLVEEKRRFYKAVIGSIITK